MNQFLHHQIVIQPRSQIQKDNKNESFEDNTDDDSDKDLYDDSEDDNEFNNANKEDKVENVSANKKKAIPVKPREKRKIVRSQFQVNQPQV